MTNINEKIAAMKAEVAEQVAKMTVAEMRKQAVNYGLKNAKQYKRAELSEKLAAQICAVQEPYIKAEAEAEAKEAQEQAKLAKKVEKKTTTGEKKDKRYKAEKIDGGEVDLLVSNLLASTPKEVKAMDLCSVNRKVLIEAMKQLHCRLWYRTYDKPTMITKITAALVKVNAAKEASETK